MGIWTIVSCCFSKILNIFIIMGWSVSNIFTIRSVLGSFAFLIAKIGSYISNWGELLQFFSLLLLNPIVFRNSKILLARIDNWYGCIYPFGNSKINFPSSLNVSIKIFIPRVITSAGISEIFPNRIQFISRFKNCKIIKSYL